MLGAELLRRRLAAGLTQEQVADRAEIDRTQVSKLERDIQLPTLRTFIRLCHATGVRAADVIAVIEDDVAALPRERR